MTGACGLKLRVMWEVKMFMAYMSMETQVVWMRQWSWWSREDRSESLFGYAVVQGGLDGSPGVPDGCRWVVRVVVEEFDELPCVISQSSCGLEDEWDQIDAGV